jgi:hypothetical protein
MIAKGTVHNNGAKLASYMTTSKDGERAELWQLRGFEATNVKDAFRDVHIMAEATKCEQPFFHVQVRNREGETLTGQQWEIAADRIERILGLSDQPRAIAFHTYEHNGDEHMHVAWSLIDEETLTAKRLPFFKYRLKTISREVEREFGFEPVRNERDGSIKYAPTRAEHEQARRLGVDIHEIRNTIRACWDHSTNGRSFEAALEHENLMLAQGDRRDFVVIDHEGGMHVLSKRTLDVTAAKIRAHLSNLAREDLPTVEEVRAFVRELKAGKQHEKPAPVWDREQATVRDEIQWQEALDRAAIAKEEKERQFVEPKEPRAQGQREKEQQTARAERPLNEAAADIRLAFALSQSPDGFSRNLDEAGFKLACVTKEEAERSRINAAFTKEVLRFAPEYREGEYVAIDELGHVYGLNQRTTGRSREEIDAFMRTIDSTTIQGIEATRQHIAAYKRPAPARDFFPPAVHVSGAIPMPLHTEPLTAWQQFGKASREETQRDRAPDDMQGPSADIWTAYKRSDSARAFVAALNERDIAVALVTREDVTKSEIDRFYAVDLNTSRKAIPPKLREGDYVAITDDARIYNLNYRTTGDSAERVQKFMATLDKKDFQSVAAVLKTVQERAELRDIERQAFRDLSAGELKRPKDTRPTGRLGREARSDFADTSHKLKSSSAVIGKTAARSIGKTLEFIGGMVESLAAPKLTPEQIHEGEKAADRREAAAENTIDFSRYTTEMAQRRQQQENEREAERRQQRDRDGGGRER